VTAALTNFIKIFPDNNGNNAQNSISGFGGKLPKSQLCCLMNQRPSRSQAPGGKGEQGPSWTSWTAKDDKVLRMAPQFPVPANQAHRKWAYYSKELFNSKFHSQKLRARAKSLGILSQFDNVKVNGTSTCSRKRKGFGSYPEAESDNELSENEILEQKMSHLCNRAPPHHKVSIEGKEIMFFNKIKNVQRTFKSISTREHNYLQVSIYPCETLHDKNPTLFFFSYSGVHVVRACKHFSFN
jgi:hypothetical protein